MYLRFWSRRVLPWCLASALGAGLPSVALADEVVQQATALVRQLLAFARKQVLTAARRSPKAIVSDMERLLLRVLPANVALRPQPIPRMDVAPASVGSS